VADPLFPPLQVTFVEEEIDDVIAVGCVMFTVCVRVQPFASVMVQVYIPAGRAVVVAAVPPDGAHE
jgi:hypothetical protein